MQRQFMFLGVFLNLVTLVLGIGIGFGAATMYLGRVHAQTTDQTTAQKIEEVTPNISSGSAAFGTLLAGRFAADEVASHGIDLYKLQINVLNVLASKPLYFSQGELQSAIDGAVVPKILKLKLPQQNPSSPKKPGEK
jgi:hypothetical protein